jgi:aerotaxis receptor
MPPHAFSDMWFTLKQGEPWSGLVKNRCKMAIIIVRANAIPIIRKGDVKGYMSVRTKPDNDEVVKAEALYQQFREECKQ